MTDVIDTANDQAALINAAQIANAPRSVPHLPYTGDCYNPVCPNTPPAPQPFCSGTCATAFKCA